jgi:hypothetical protein
MQICNNTKVYFINPISKQKVVTTVIIGLSGVKIDGRIVMTDHVVVKVQEVFKFDAMVPFSMQTIEPCESAITILVGAIIFWLFKISQAF